MQARMLALLAALAAAIAALVAWTFWPESPAESDRDMVWIPAGRYLMGDALAEGYPDDGETPVHPVVVPGFWMDRCEVTNAQFDRFVVATNYRTEAEVFGWSGVPIHLLSGEQREKYPPTRGWAPHWRPVPGADWRHPEGPGSSIADRMDHPVVHVSWNDAVAYCRWLSTVTGKKYRLPTEAEWEYAARGGLDRQRLPWGNEFKVNGRWACNIWQGAFPDGNTAEDGFPGTAPVGRCQPTPFGLHDMSGNVWEWCADYFDPDYYERSPVDNPKGPDAGRRRVQRGGSYICCERSDCCYRFRVAARYHNDPDSGMANSGFRCVREE